MNNLLKRTIFGALFVLIMFCGIYFCRYGYLVISLFILSGMMKEFYQMTMGDRYKYSRGLAIAAGVIFFCITFLCTGCNLSQKAYTISMLPVFIVMINSLYVKDKSEFGKFANVYTGLLYIAVPLSTMNSLVFSGDTYSGVLLLCFFGIIWASDIGAYAFGITLGQRFGKKLFPEVSPKKSWIGFYGGLLTAVLLSMIFYWIGIFDYEWYHCVGLAVVMNIMGVYGDLIESQWKRYYLIKDSGNAIPGHGGLLDRFDSSLLAIPSGIIYLSIFNLL